MKKLIKKQEQQKKTNLPQLAQKPGLIKINSPYFTLKPINIIKFPFYIDNAGSDSSAIIGLIIRLPGIQKIKISGGEIQVKKEISSDIENGFQL